MPFPAGRVDGALLAQILQVPHGTGLAGQNRLPKYSKKSYSTPPVPPSGRESMIEWRDIRSVKALRLFLRDFAGLEHDEQQRIHDEMYGYLADVRQMDVNHLTYTEKQAPAEQAKDTFVKRRRRRPSRRY